MTIGSIYVGLFVLGVAYALISAFLGWIGDVGGDGGDGGGGIHVDASGHVDAVHPHPISGTIIATFVTGFGGGGILAHHVFRWGLLPGALAALASGLTLAAAAFLALELLFKHTEAGSEFGLDEAVGVEAEVITNIPADGTGEVALVMHAQRESAPARSVAGEIPRGTVVVVERVTGNTFYVRPKKP